MSEKKSETDVARLKDDWKHDPCWDIEDTPGFEEFREELKNFRLATEEEWKKEKHVEIVRMARNYACSHDLAKLLISLQERVEVLEKKLEEGKK